jgi:hypothetical protein
MPAKNRTTHFEWVVNPQDPSTYLKPDEPLIGSDGRDWSWAYVVFGDIERYVGYRLGSNGSVWSRWCPGGCRRGHVLGDTWKRMKLRVNRRGYVEVTLRERRAIWVHTLVLEAIAGAKLSGQQCRHLDGNKTHNRFANLAWGTPLENIADRENHGHTAYGARNGNVRYSDEAVTKLRSLVRQGMTRTDAARLVGISKSHACRIIKGEFRKQAP